MSRAFVKDSEDRETFDLPDRPISTHPNFVTAEGMEAIEAEVAHWQRDLTAAQTADDREQQAKAGRELRYWLARRGSAQVVAPPKDAKEVHFGSTVVVERDDGRRQTFRIVGEDEADPAHGTLSHASPLARALFGKSVGDVVQVANGEAEVVDIR
jgi:transcription elongation GreA/GreB family factor